MANSSFWDSFAGVWQTLCQKGWTTASKCGMSMIRDRLRQEFADAENKYDEDQRALEHLQKAQSSAGKAITVPDENGVAQEHRSRAVDDAWLRKQQEQSLQNKKESQKQAFLQHGSPEEYLDYQIKSGQASKATLEGRIAEGRSQVLNDIMRIRKDPQFALQAATQMGFLPEGSRIDMKTGTIITPDGRTQQITSDMMNQFVRQYQREKYADLLTSMDDIFNADTYDARKEAIELKPWETKQKIALQQATLEEQRRHNRAAEGLAKEKYEAEKTKSGKPEDLYLGDPDGFGAKPILGKKTQNPTGYVQDGRGNRWPSEFNTLDDFRAAVEEAQKYGVKTIQNNKTGAIGYQAGENVFSSMTEAINHAKDHIKKVQKNAKKYHEDHVAKRAAPDIQRAAEAHKNSATNYFGLYEKDS